MNRDFASVVRNNYVNSFELTYLNICLDYLLSILTMLSDILMLSMPIKCSML